MFPSEFFSKQWYLLRPNEPKQGPMSLREIVQSRPDPNDRVRRGTGPKWVLWDKALGLYPELNQMEDNLFPKPVPEQEPKPAATQQPQVTQPVISSGCGIACISIVLFFVVLYANSKWGGGGTVSREQRERMRQQQQRNQEIRERPVKRELDRIKERLLAISNQLDALRKAQIKPANIDKRHDLENEQRNLWRQSTEFEKSLQR